MIFNRDAAVKYGLEEAIFIKHFQFWIEKNIANKKHCYDERYWTYNSYKAFTKMFPFWTEKQIRRILTSLIEQGVLVKTDQYNNKNYDKTSWYAFKDQSEFIEIGEEKPTTRTGKGVNTDCPNGQRVDCPNGQTPLPIWANASAQMGKPIPDSVTYSDTGGSSSSDYTDQGETSKNQNNYYHNSENKKEKKTPDFTIPEDIAQKIRKLYLHFANRIEVHWTEVDAVRKLILTDIELPPQRVWENAIIPAFADWNSWDRKKQNTKYLTGAIKGKREEYRKKWKKDLEDEKKRQEQLEVEKDKEKHKDFSLIKMVEEEANKQGNNCLKMNRSP